MTSTATGHLRDRLAKAVKARSLVRLGRSPRNADQVDGFVLAVGRKWALVAQTRDGGYADGLVAVRVKDLVSVKDDSSFEGRFARTQTLPKAPPGLDLDTTSGLLQGLSQLAPLLRIEQERRYKSEMTWVGTVEEAGDGWLWLQEVMPDASWRKRSRGYRLKRITKVVILDGYLTALATVLGLPAGARACCHPETVGSWRYGSPD